MIHSSFYKPKIFPRDGDVSPAEIDRAQSIEPTGTLNREAVEEIGRDGRVGHLKKTSRLTYRLTQLEYGSFEFWRKLANKADNVHSIDLNDFKTARFDIAAYLTDDDKTFRGTVLYPNLRTTGFSFTIGNPDATIERSFDFVGERALTWQGDNKYFVYIKKEVQSGDLSGTDYAVTLDDPQPVQNPDDNSYIYRILRVRGTETTELEDSDYSFTSPSSLTIHNAQVGDIYKIYYTASSYISGETPFELNDTDLVASPADTVSIFLSTGEYIYRLQSVSFDIRFDREDVKGIGNKNVVKTGIRNKTVTVTLGKILDGFTLEEALRGVSAGYGLIDMDKFGDNIGIYAKVYSDDTKSTFKLGYKATKLSVSEVRGGSAAINEYVKKDISLTGEEFEITDTSF